MALDSEIVSH